MKSRKSPPKHLEVRLNGATVEGRNATDKFVETIRRIGPETVEKLRLELSGNPLVSREPTSPLGERQVGLFYIATHSSTVEKEHVLRTVAARLGIDLRVEVINPREVTIRLLGELEA